MDKNSLQYKCVKLTGSFETGTTNDDAFSSISGNFDGQGISYGALQWNFGQNSLQPILKKFISLYPSIIQKIFKNDYLTLYHALDNGSFEFSKTIQTSGFKIISPWKEYFYKLGQTKEMKQIQSESASVIFNRACKKLKDLNSSMQYPMETERAVTLMFDIYVQNGGIRKNISHLKEQLRIIDIGSEVDKLREIALHVANNCNPKWRDDVLSRKMCIANGKGIVHRTNYSLEDYGITLTKTKG